MIPPEQAEVAEAQMQAGVYPQALGPAYAEIGGVDFTVPLSRFPGPGLILNGERDHSPRQGAARFVAAMRQGRVEVIPNAGHACNLDQPEAFNRALRAFGREIGWISS